MDHKHLNLQDLFEISLLPDKAEQDERIEHCDYCRTRLNKAGNILPKLREREFSPTEDLYNNIKSSVKTGDDFFKFISGSKYAKKKEQPGKPDIRRFGLRHVTYAAAGLAAACILLFMNFYYYLFLPDNNFIKTSAGVKISRQGFAAGRIGVNTDAILIGRDKVSNENSDIVINTGRGMKLYIKRMSRFNFYENDNAFAASIESGVYFIRFDKSYKKKRIVDLPLDSRVIITGTEIYFNADKDNYTLYLKEGKAELDIPGKPEGLKSGMMYALTKGEPLESKPLSEQDAQKLFEPFMGLDDFKSLIKPGIDADQPDNSGKKRKSSIEKQRETGLSLPDLKKKYGTLSVITTKDNKKFIGAFSIMGDKIEIITTAGKVILPSSDVKNLSPYQD